MYEWIHVLVIAESSPFSNSTHTKTHRPGGIGYYDSPMQQVYSLLTEGHVPRSLVVGRGMLSIACGVFELDAAEK